MVLNINLRRAISPKTHSKVTMGVRLTNVMLCLNSLLLLVRYMLKATNSPLGHSDTRAHLPIAALTIATLWNLLAAFTVKSFNRFIHPVCDFLTALLLVVLGAIFYSDPTNKALFFHPTRWETVREGWSYVVYRYDTYKEEAIAAGVVMIFAVILQIFSIVWGFIHPTAPVQSEFNHPPNYNEERYPHVHETSRSIETVSYNESVQPNQVIFKDEKSSSEVERPQNVHKGFVV